MDPRIRQFVNQERKAEIDCNPQRSLLGWEGWRIASMRWNDGRG
jgi:hypothetical protein